MLKTIIRIGAAALVLQVSVVLAAEQSVVNVPVFAGGLQVKNINQCNQMIQNQCQMQAIQKRLNCLEHIMSEQPMCTQNLALLKTKRGIFKEIKKYNSIDVVYAEVAAADHSDEYFMVNPQGDLMELAGDLNLKNNRAYDKLHKKFPDATLWPITANWPAEQLMPRKAFQLIFKQKLTDGCYACKIAGYADVAYTFKDDGELIGVKLQTITSE